MNTPDSDSKIYGRLVESESGLKFDPNAPAPDLGEKYAKTAELVVESEFDSVRQWCFVETKSGRNNCFVPLREIEIDNDTNEIQRSEQMIAEFETLDESFKYNMLFPIDHAFVPENTVSFNTNAGHHIPNASAISSNGHLSGNNAQFSSFRGICDALNGTYGEESDFDFRSEHSTSNNWFVVRDARGNRSRNDPTECYEAYCPEEALEIVDETTTRPKVLLQKSELLSHSDRIDGTDGEFTFHATEIIRVQRSSIPFSGEELEEIEEIVEENRQ